MLQAAPVIAFLSGLFAGTLHVISGPDHVAAVAPLALKAPRAGRGLGALWGVGHGGGVLLWVLGAALFQRSFGREFPSAALEALVGLALLGLGVLSVREPSRPHLHVHAHGPVKGHIPVPNDRAHVHLHAHSAQQSHDHHHDARFRGGAAALALGALHGSAGASHLLALLPTLGLAGSGAVAYAIGYLLAGVIAMAGVGALLARFAARSADVTRLRRFCAWSVVAIGAFWLASALHEFA